MCNKEKTYTLVLRSANRTFGTNSNATFSINWERILPPEYQEFNLKVMFISETIQYDPVLEPSCIETRISMGKVFLQDTNNIESIVHHSGVNTLLNNNSTTTYGKFETINKDLVYTVNRPTDNIINIRNFNFEQMLANPNLSTVYTSTADSEPNYIVYLQFTPIK